MRAMILDASAEIDESPPPLPLTLREVEAPRPGAGELRVRVTACAVCRTDLHVIEGDLPERIRPIIPGHQAVGVVDELGDGCTRFALGDRVGITCLAGSDGTNRIRNDVLACSRVSSAAHDQINTVTTVTTA